MISNGTESNYSSGERKIILLQQFLIVPSECLFIAQSNTREEWMWIKWQFEIGSIRVGIDWLPSFQQWTSSRTLVFPRLFFRCCCCCCWWRFCRISFYEIFILLWFHVFGLVFVKNKTFLLCHLSVYHHTWHLRRARANWGKPSRAELSRARQCDKCVRLTCHSLCVCKCLPCRFAFFHR